MCAQHRVVQGLARVLEVLQPLVLGAPVADEHSGRVTGALAYTIAY